MDYEEFKRRVRGAGILNPNPTVDGQLVENPFGEREADTVYQRLKEVTRGLKDKRLFHIVGSKGKEYVWVFLWENYVALRQNAQTPKDEVARFHVVAPFSVVEEPGLHGVFHFLSGNWNTNVVAHNVGHFVFHLMRIRASWTNVLKSEPGANTEEFYCQCLGQMTDDMVDWLWSIDQLSSAEVTSDDPSEDPQVKQ